MVLIGIGGLILLALVALVVWRQFDHRADRDEMARLLASQPNDPPLFDRSMVDDLPDPARRYFFYTIAEGTPLHTVVRIEMEGRFSLGTKEAPNYLPMEATQILAAPEGFVWKMSAASGAMRMSGSDSASWTRFWLWGLVPVARLGGDEDHARSAFGRYVAESVFWTPAALLPGPGIEWEAVDEQTARVTVRYQGLEQSVDVIISSDGQPIRVEFQRWSDANPEKTFRLQPFGGHLSGFRTFQGFRLPTHVEAGNLFGTEDYFPFFIAEVKSVRFSAPRSNGRGE